jgi:hypothetical protein
MRSDTKIYILTIIGLLVSSGSAFNSVGKTKIPHSWSLSATNDRRNFISSAFLAVTTVSITNAQPASATYSAYTNREKDWEERQKKGDVKFSSARDLKAQLREIAPMNSESSKVFCPNGPSSAVSPLMENKCGDKLAMPSVYGRTQDIVGNSIPGFTSTSPYSTASLNAQAGGFPSYK